MKILRVSDLIKEANHTQDKKSFEYIFMDLIDDEFTIEVENMYFDSDWGKSSMASVSNRKPGYVIKLHKPTSVESVSTSEIKKIASIIEECNNRIEDIGEFIVDEFSFQREYILIEYKIVDKDSKEEEVNESEGFEMFRNMIVRKFKERSNIITRSFTLEINKDGIFFVPINDSVKVSLFKSGVKRLVRESVARRFYLGGGPNWVYKFDVDIVDNKIHIIFKERIDETTF